MTNVGWDNLGDGHWQTSEARVDVDCQLRRWWWTRETRSGLRPDGGKGLAAIRNDSGLFEKPERFPRARTTVEQPR